MPRKNNPMKTTRSTQKGVMLLEALIGVLIFSIGILALIAMQSVAVSQVRDANYRSTASMLADRMMGELTVIRNTTTGTNPAFYNAKLTQWQIDVAAALPAGTGTVTLTPSALNNTLQDTRIVINWRAPNATANSNHVVVGVLSP
jgi:type IV pilus assembly protein PilV